MLNPGDVKAQGFKPMQRASTMPAKNSPKAKPVAARVEPPALNEPITKISLTRQLPKEVDLGPFYKYIEEREELYVSRLAEAVSIRSVSAWPDHRGEVMLNARAYMRLK